MEKRDVTIQVRMKATGVAKIDELRGELTRSEWIRKACAKAVHEGFTGQRMEVL